MAHQQNTDASTRNRKRSNWNDTRPRKRFQRRQPAPPPPKPICSVCADPEKNPSYKCPKCLALYCSVSCCKQHKENCTGNPPEMQQTKSVPFFAPSRPPSHGNHRYGSDNDDDDSSDEGWKITDSMKSALKNSDWLKNELNDQAGLKELISQIVVSKNKEALSQAQERYPNVRVFLDKLLVVAGVLKREEDENDNESLSEWLERNWANDPQPPMLTLKPIPRSIVPMFEPVHASSSSSSSSSDEEEEEEEEESSSSSESSSEEEDSNEESSE